MEIKTNEKKFNIAIIGGGPAGVMCAIHAAQNPKNTICIIEQKELLATILPTGGGRCNIAHKTSDIRQLASNYPRGEKFLLSPFSSFSTKDTMEFFKRIGLPLKVMDNDKIFPITENSGDVQRVLINHLNNYPNITVIKARVFEVRQSGKKFTIDCHSTTITAEAVVFATGSNPSGYRLAASLGHSIVQAKPSLCPLLIRERQFNTIPGVSVQNVAIKAFWNSKNVYKTEGDLLFTHKGLSGPAILEISAICAEYDISNADPLKLQVNFVREEKDKFGAILRNEINKNSKKTILNVCSKFIPRFAAQILLEDCDVDIEGKAAELKKIKFDSIVESFTSYVFNVTGRESDKAMVTAGGVSLKEINNKTMQSKKTPNVYFCGEIMDIDGLCGGFNLQNCWTTGYVAGSSIKLQHLPF